MNASNKNKISNKTKGEKNELEVLRILRNTGWATNRMIGEWCFYDYRTEAGKIVKAQEVTKRLEEKGMVLRRQTPKGVTAWILTEAGIDKIKTSTGQEWGNAGYDLGFTNEQVLEIVFKQAVELRKKGFTGLLGKPGLRAGLVGEAFKKCDAVAIKLENGSYTLKGIVAISNARDANLERIRDLLQRNVDISLAFGDTALIKTVQRRLGVKINF